MVGGSGIGIGEGGTGVAVAGMGVGDGSIAGDTVGRAVGDGNTTGVSAAGVWGAFNTPDLHAASTLNTTIPISIRKVQDDTERIMLILLKLVLIPCHSTQRSSLPGYIVSEGPSTTLLQGSKTYL